MKYFDIRISVSYTFTLQFSSRIQWTLKLYHHSPLITTPYNPIYSDCLNGWMHREFHDRHFHHLKLAFMRLMLHLLHLCVVLFQIYYCIILPSLYHQERQISYYVLHCMVGCCFISFNVQSDSSAISIFDTKLYIELRSSIALFKVFKSVLTTFNTDVREYIQYTVPK